MEDLKQNLICWLPCDEEEGEVIYDYANRNDATYAGERTEGAIPGKAVKFEGANYANISNLSQLDLSQPWAVHFWIKSDSDLIPIVHFTEPLKHTRKDISTNGNWSPIGIVSAGNIVSYYFNGVLADVFNVTDFGDPIGLTVSQPNYMVGGGVGEIDDFRVYQDNLNAADMLQLSEFRHNKLAYYLDGINLADFGLTIYAHKGLISVPDMKAPLKIDWPSEHGEVIDLSDPTYEARDITLQCWIKATSRAQFIERINTLLNTVLLKPGLRELQVDLHPTKPLIYHVYMSKGFDVSQEVKYNASIQAGKFELKFREPNPFKKVLKQVLKVPGSVSISFNTTKRISIVWGDGTVSSNRTGEVAITKNYTEPDEYIITLYGDIKDITNLSHNAIEIWSSL